jgi:hypothetical protein
MLLLGLVLLGATGAFAGLLISENSSGGPEYAVTMFGNDLGTVNTLGAFLSGIALTLVFCLALAMMMSGTARHRRRNRELRTMRREAARNGDPTGSTGTAGPVGTTASTGTDPATTTAPETTTRRHRKVHIFGH